MKKIIFIIAIAITALAQGQTNTTTIQGAWSLSGNVVRPFDWLGTRNNENLIFKTNATPRGFLSKNGGFFSGSESDINSFLAQNALSFTGFSTINQHHSVLNYGDSGFSFNYNNITFGGNPLNPTIALSNSSIGKFHGINYDGTGNFRTVAAMLFTNVGQPTTTSMPTKITFATTPINSVTRLERLVINENGNVGVGTTAPLERLDVAGNLKFSGSLMPNNTAGATGQVLTSAGAGVPPTWNNVAPQINSDWNATSGVAQILNKPLVQAPISVTAPITLTGATVGITTATTTINGQLLATDFVNFNNKIGTANNGLTATGTLVELGGTLTKNTNINQNNFNLTTSGTGSVGIGTNAPIGKLDIVSDAAGQLLFSRYGGQPRLILRRAQGTFASPTAVPSGASTLINFDNFDGTNFGTSAQIQVVPGNQTPTNKGASMALNVAIENTTSVINGLIVGGSSACAGCVTITDNFNPASARLTIRPNTVFTPNVPYFDIKTGGGSDLLQFSNAGNLRVGLGATDDARLSVAGQVKITGGTPGLNKVLTSDATGLATWQPITVPTFDATINFSVNANPNTAGTTFSPNTPNSTTVIYVSSIDGSQWTYNGTAYITAPVSADWKVTGNAGMVQATNFIGTTDNVGLSFRTNNVIRQTITNTGSVGIGTSTPSALFHLNTPTQVTSTVGASQIIQRLQSNANNQVFLDLTSRRHTAGTDWNGTNYRLQKTVDSSPMGFIDFGINGLTGNTGLGFGTNNTTNLVLDSFGNLGIGITTPTQKLDVTGNINQMGTAGTPGSVQHLAGQTSPFSGKTVFGTDNTGWKYAISKRAGAVTTDLMTIQDDGNVGVGTTTPTAKLSVSGIIDNTSNVISTGNIAGNLFHGIINTNTGTSAASLLTLGNSANANAANLILGGSGFTAYGGANSLNLVNSLNSPTTFWTNNIQRATILGNGNVGINTNTPTAKLDITGNIKIADGTQGAGKVLTSDATGLASWQSTTTAWTAVTFFAPWGNFGSGFQTVQFRKNGDNVELRGLANGGANQTILFTLPAGFRPLNRLLFTTLSNNAIARIDIENTGLVSMQVGISGSWISFDSISFSTL